MEIKHALFAVLFVLNVSVIAVSGSVLAQDAKSSPQTLKGQLLMLAGEVAIIRDSSGKTTHVPVSKATKVERGIKDGDMVEASLSDGQATSIKPSK
jgi:hypothetical protein